MNYHEACRRFEVNSRDQIKSWERICPPKVRKDWRLSVEGAAVRDVEAPGEEVEEDRHVCP